MATAAAIITYNRPEAAARLVESISRHSPGTQIFVVDDHSSRRPPMGSAKRPRPDLEGTECLGGLAGWSRLGVAGNSNRALKLLLETKADHFMLLNDDVVYSGPASEAYEKAHAALGVGLFCGADRSDRRASWEINQAEGEKVKVLRRLPGAVMSMTRKLVETIGFFDTRFGQFGQEHVDFTHRARAAGAIGFGGRQAYGLDIEENFCGRQDVAPSTSPQERKRVSWQAELALELAMVGYQFADPYRQFSLFRPIVSDAFGPDGLPLWDSGILEVSEAVGQPPVNLVLD